MPTLRKCIVSGQQLDQSEMIRFVLSPDSIVTPDLKSKLPGRGIWLSGTREALETAIEKNLFAKSAKAKAIIPDDLTTMVQNLMRRDAISTLSLARKAGQAVCGYEKVADMAGKDAGLLLLASDAGKDGQKRFANLLHKYELPNYQLLSAQDQSKAMGREHVVHIAVQKGSFSRNLAVLFARLEVLLPIPLSDSSIRTV